MARIQFFQGASLDNIPAVKTINPYREQVKNNLAQLVCDYFELSVVKGGDLASVGQSFEATIADICKVLELSDSEAEEFTGCVEIEIIEEQAPQVNSGTAGQAEGGAGNGIV